MTKDDPQTDLLVDIQLICKDYGSASNPHLAVTLCRYIEHREQAEIERLREALEHYADPENWSDCAVGGFFGERAYEGQIGLEGMHGYTVAKAALGGEVNDGQR